VAVLTIAVLGAYHEFITWMVGQWWRDEYYGHGIFIPFLSGYLLYRLSKHLGSVGPGQAWGLLLVGLSLLGHMLALYLGVHFASGFALVGTLVGLVIWLWGWQTAWRLAFPLAFLLFMVPLSRLLVDRLAQPLQLFSARGAGALTSALLGGVKVEGTMLITRDYTFEVAIPCSGLKSIIAMSALGGLMAYVLEGPVWKRAVLFAMSVPVAVVANLIRIFVTVVLGNSIGPAAAEGFFHQASGAAVFVIAFGGLMLLGEVLGCRQIREDI
jgi:exosortase